jgi:hypothetical protein
MRSLALKTGITVVALVCLCSLFLVTTARSSRIPNNPVVDSAKLSGANMGGSGVKSATTCITEDGGCNGAANYTLYPSTGCQWGFQNYGGICKRRSSFISGCAQQDGIYDEETCTCTFSRARGSR